MWLNPQGTPDLVTFTEEILNGKLHFLCSSWSTHIWVEYWSYNGPYNIATSFANQWNGFYIGTSVMQELMN